MRRRINTVAVSRQNPSHLNITIKHAKANSAADELSLAYFETVVAAVSVKMDASRITQQSVSDFPTYSLKRANDSQATLSTSASSSNCKAAESEESGYT